MELFGNFFTKQSGTIQLYCMKVVKKTLLDKQPLFCGMLVSYIFSAHHCKCFWLNSSKVMLSDRSALLISAKRSSSVTSTFGLGNNQLIRFVLVVAIIIPTDFFRKSTNFSEIEKSFSNYSIFFFLCLFCCSSWTSVSSGASIGVPACVTFGSSCGTSVSTRRKISSLSMGRMSACHLKP